MKSLLLCLTLAASLTTPLAAAQAPAPRLPVWRERMAPLVPLTYVARHTATAITVNGKLDDPAWATAPWTADFVDIEGDLKPQPRHRTRAKMLWDDTHLYVAAELTDPHLWGTLTKHDSVIFQDPDFEIFLDPDGDTHAYYEFELNALNTGWDLFLSKPYMDRGKALNTWSIPGLKTAVHLRGTLNDPSDTDTGWTLEMAFPWSAFIPPADAPVPSAPAAEPTAPAEGAQWRINFSRVQWQFTTADGHYKKIPKTPENNWVWSPQGVIDMHRPEMWGLVRFTRRPAAEPVAVVPPPGPAARSLALEFYYAQHDFFRANQRWAETLAELGWSAPPATNHAAPPKFTFTPNAEGYEFSVPFTDGPRPGTWTIRQDRHLTLR